VEHGGESNAGAEVLGVGGDGDQGLGGLLRCAAASAIWRYNSYIPSPFIGSTNNSVNAHIKASQNRRASGSHRQDYR